MADSSLHVVTANVDKATRGAKMRAAIDLPARGADVVAYQEVERLRHVKAVAALSGFDAYLPAGRKRSWKNACPIVWRDHLTRLDAGWVLIGKGVRLIQPNRVATWVLLRDDDPARTTYAVVSAHTVSGIWKRALRKIAAWAGRTRRQESDRELAAIAALAQQLRSRADVVIVMGDLNRPERISPALIGCDQIIYASAPTHGRHWFDLIGLIGATGSGAHRIATPSDHDALAATVTPTSSSKPPTRKQEEPVSVAPPSPPFIAARHHGGHQTPRAIVMHGTVSPCDRGRARSIAAWWHGSGSPVTSAHYIVDPYQIVQCVGDHTVAYHCGYNDGSIGIELCDPETGPASRWHDHAHDLMLDRAADLVARLCLAYDIAPEHVGSASLKAHGPHGIYSHNQSRLAFGHTTHTDPRGFPWGDFMRRVHAAIDTLRGDPAARTAPHQSEEDDMAEIRVKVPRNEDGYADIREDENGEKTYSIATALSKILWRLNDLDEKGK